MINNITYYKHKITYFFWFIAIILLSTNLLGCSKKYEPISKSAVLFDTYITITIYDSDNTALLEKSMDLCKEYENMLSATVNDSDIDKINNANGQYVSINPETLELIEDSLYYSEITDGKFDVTIYSDYILWDFHDINNPLPNEADINAAIKHIGYKNIKPDKDSGSVKLSDPASKIELGGIAKGYIADRIGDYLSGEGISSAIINIGGDIKTIGEKPDKKPYVIGIQDPNNKSGIINTLSISDYSVTTSGTYERYILDNNVKYHHILDPLTGYPVETDIESVTVISKNAETADALCTSIILIGKDAALPLIESLDDTECIITTTDKSQFLSSGASKYIVQ